MLAGINDYFHNWMLPLFGVIIFAWLFFGGLLFQKFIKPISDRKKIPLGHGIWLSFISGISGIITTGCVFWMVAKLTSSFTPMFIFGAIFGILTFLITVVATIYSVKKCTIQKACQASIIPALGIIISTGIFIVPAAFISFQNRHATLQEQRLNSKAGYRIAILSRMLKDLSYKKIPQTLEEIIEDYKKLPEKNYNLTEKQYEELAVNPKFPEKKDGFIYIPFKRLNFDASQSEESTPQILICENPNYCKKNVHFSYIDRSIIKVISYNKLDFKELLNKPENKSFKDKIDSLKE